MNEQHEKPAQTAPSPAGPNGPGGGAGGAGSTDISGMANAVYQEAMAAPGNPGGGSGPGVEGALDIQNRNNFEYLKGLLENGLGYRVEKHPQDQGSLEFHCVYDGDEFLGGFWVDKNTGDLAGRQRQMSGPNTYPLVTSFKTDRQGGKLIKETWQRIQLHYGRARQNSSHMVAVGTRCVEVFVDDVPKDLSHSNLKEWKKMRKSEQATGARPHPTTIPFISHAHSGNQAKTFHRDWFDAA